MIEYSNLQELAEASRNCVCCGLCKQRTQVVPGEGDERAEIMFIGEGPGFHEDKQGRPFVGAAGQLLDGLLGTIGLTRPQVFITNVVKCRPPGNRDPMPEEVAACRSWLDQQIRLLEPKLIVTLGRHAMGIFMPGEVISKMHGLPKRFGNYMVMPIYHPAAALYQQSLKKTLETDFLKILDALKAATIAADPKPPLPSPERQQPLQKQQTPQKQEEKPNQLSMF